MFHQLFFLYLLCSPPTLSSFSPLSYHSFPLSVLTSTPHVAEVFRSQRVEFKEVLDVYDQGQKFRVEGLGVVDCGEITSLAPLLGGKGTATTESADKIKTKKAMTTTEIDAKLRGLLNGSKRKVKSSRLTTTTTPTTTATTTPTTSPNLTKKQLLELYPDEGERNFAKQCMAVNLYDSHEIDSVLYSGSLNFPSVRRKFKRFSIRVLGDRVVNGGWEPRPPTRAQVGRDPGQALVRPENFTKEQKEAARNLKEFKSQQRQWLQSVDSFDAIDAVDVVDMRKVPMVAIDSESTAFRDDGISVIENRITGQKTLVVSIVDVSVLFDTRLRSSPLGGGATPTTQQRGGAAPPPPPPHPHPPPHKIDETSREYLRKCAQDRVESIYSPKQNSLLLPPVALKALSLSESDPNLCVSLFARFDVDNNLLSTRFSRTVHGPCTVYTHEKFAERGADDATLIAAGSLLNAWSTAYKTQVVSSEKRAAMNNSASKTLTDDSLSLYSAAAEETLGKKSKANFVIRTLGTTRVATAPLRRWIDGIAQSQLLRTLYPSPGNAPFGSKECRGYAKHAMAKRNEISSFNDKMRRFKSKSKE